MERSHQGPGRYLNAPNEHFGSSYEDTCVTAINWIRGTNRTEFVCANEQYYLLRNSVDTWPPGNCDQFLNALAQYRRDWS